MSSPYDKNHFKKYLLPHVSGGCAYMFCRRIRLLGAYRLHGGYSIVF